MSATTLGITPSATALGEERKKYPDHKRPFRVPGGTVGLWACVIEPEVAGKGDATAPVAGPQE